MPPKIEATAMKHNGMGWTAVFFSRKKKIARVKNREKFPCKKKKAGEKEYGNRSKMCT